MRTLTSLALAVFLVAAGAGAASAHGRVGLGLRATSMDVAGSAGAAATTLDGVGVFLRLNLTSRIGLEVAADQLSTVGADGATRGSTPLSASVLAYLSRGSIVDLYILGGLGTTADKVSLTMPDHSTVSQTYDQSELHAGLGAEISLGSLTLGGEIRAVGLKLREPTTSALLPAESKAVVLNVGLAYFF